jgi:hypothetical protein
VTDALRALTPRDPCPGCGKPERDCPQYGDECWRNNGCPASPPDRVPDPCRGREGEAVLVRALCLVLLALGCSGADGPRVLFLERQEVRGMNRICTYKDFPGEYVVTVRSWEACEPEIEVDG